jgi:hypothetical protein
MTTKFYESKMQILLEEFEHYIPDSKDKPQLQMDELFEKFEKRRIKT